MGERLSITLPPEMVRTIRQTVAAGRYESASALVREALAAWQRREGEDAARLAAIRARIEASLADPRPDMSSEEVDRFIDELVRRA